MAPNPKKSYLGIYEHPLVEKTLKITKPWYDALSQLLASGNSSLVAGPNGSVQYNDNGVQAGDANLTWDKTKQQEKITSIPFKDSGVVVTANGGHVSITPSGATFNDIYLGGVQDTAGDLIPDATVLGDVFTVDDGGSQTAGIGLDYGLTPGSPDPFTTGVGFKVTTPTDSSGDPIAALRAYQYGGLGTGAVPGMAIGADRNDSGTGAASTIFGQLKDGRFFVFWVDNTGAPRWNVGATLAAIRPTESGSVSDTSGNLFGSGTGGGTITNIFSRRPDEGRSGIPGTQGPQGAAGATGATGPQGPAGSQVPIVVTTNTTLATQTCWVVSESLEIAAGIILEIAGGARVEITGAAGYPPPAFVKISEVVPSAATGTVTFASIPQTFTHLKILYTGRSTIAAFSDTLNIRVNGDTAANYDIERIQAFATTLTAAETIGGTSGQLAQISGASAPSGLSGSGEITCENYTNQAFNKIGTSLTAYKQDVTTGNTRMNHYGWSWRNSAAITQIDLILGSGNFVAGSKFSLYGIT